MPDGHPKRVLDLFCGAGGAAMGLHQAWPEAEITGVDIKWQKNYCGHEFIQGDALQVLRRIGREFDFIWASPMCQAHTWAARRWKKTWPQQIEPIRNALMEIGVPFTIENVVGAPLIKPIRLCGISMGLRVIRHRLFESNFTVQEPEHVRCSGMIATGQAYTVAGHGAESKSYKQEDWAEAMQIYWMTKQELTQSVPPAYSRYIAEQFTKYQLSLREAALA